MMKETFRATTSAEDEDTIMKNFQRYAQNTIYEIERLEVHYEQHHYPGKRVLSSGKALMQSVVQIQSALDFFTTVSRNRMTSSTSRKITSQSRLSLAANSPPSSPVRWICLQSMMTVRPISSMLNWKI